MDYPYKNFVFAGGGMWGIAYIGLLQYLDEIGVTPSIEKVAGTSVGAITACLTSFNLPFTDFKFLSDSLDYRKIPQQDIKKPVTASKPFKEKFNKIVDNIDCVHRLINDYGWYATDYLYHWLQEKIAEQFDEAKKKPPYTFSDFEDNTLHKEERPFKKLYLIATNMTDVTRVVFSYETTPHMEVALAVRASMSVPLLFSPVLLEGKAGESLTHFADGGMLANYPVDFFDKFCSFEETLGANFQTTPYNKEIKTLVDYMGQFLACNTRLQDMIYQTPENKKRTIFIPVGALNPLDFEVDLHGVIYNFLYIQGYESAKKYFMAH